MGAVDGARASRKTGQDTLENQGAASRHERRFGAFHFPNARERDLANRLWKLARRDGEEVMRAVVQYLGQERSHSSSLLRETLLFAEILTGAPPSDNPQRGWLARRLEQLITVDTISGCPPTLLRTTRLADVARIVGIINLLVAGDFSAEEIANVDHFLFSGCVAATVGAPVAALLGFLYEAISIVPHFESPKALRNDLAQAIGPNLRGAVWGGSLGPRDRFIDASIEAARRRR